MNDDFSILPAVAVRCVADLVGAVSEAFSDSSYYLEVAASEFKVQGLEIDYAVLAWDADLRYTINGFDYFKFRGTRWNHVNLKQRQQYLKNAYRVLLTRARQGLIIYVPEGNKEDPSRLPEYYDGIYQYLKSAGIEEI